MCKDDRRVSFPDASRLTWIVTCCNGEGFENFHYRGIGTDYGEGPFGYDVISHGIGPIANSRAHANHLLDQHREIVRQCKNSQFHFTHAAVAALLVGGTALAAAISVAFLTSGIDRKLDGHALAQTEFVNRLDLTEVRFISNDELTAVAERHGATPDEAADAAMINEAARLKTLKYSFFCLSLIAILPIAVAFFLPRKPCVSSR